MTFDQAKQAATEIAAEAGESCYIADCAVYCDEFEEGTYIVGTKAVFAIMFEKLHEVGGKVVGVVDAQGSFFTNDLALALGELG